MDPPENSVNRIGRTVWTVWGYLSGAVARYLRPEVTAEGNQSVRARTDETDLKSAVNKTDREVKTNNRDSEHERAEVKCSSSKVRVQVASVQWENTGVVKNDNNDELHVHTTKKQTYHCAAWSTATETDSKGQGDDPAEKEAVSSDEVQAEEVYADSESKERDLEVTGKNEQKDGDNEEKEECVCNHEDEKCDMTRKDADNTDIMVQYEQDVEQDKQINMMDGGETEETGDLKHADEHPTDETEKQIVELKDQRKTEDDEDQGTESQVQDLLEYLTEEANSISKPERLKAVETYSDEIKFSKNRVEEMMPEAEQDEDTTEREQDMTKYELMESVETLQRVSEEHAPNDETELKMTTVVDETTDTLEDTLQSDSKQDTSENTPETGTGSTVLATKTEGMFSDRIVCEFPGELRKGPEIALAETDLGCFEEIKTKLHDPQTPAEREAVIAGCVEHSETRRAADTETVIQSFSATESEKIDKTEFSLKEDVEFRTQLIVETIETKISSEDEEAEASETESQSLVIRNVTLQPHEFLEFTEEQCKSSQGTMDAFSETQGNSNTSEITGAAEHVAEDQTDVKPVSTRSLSPIEFLEEALDLQRCNEEQEIPQTDLAKTALEYVEEITNQVLKEMIETECNLEQKTEPLVGLSTEEPADAEYQAPVLEEEGKLLAETMDSMVEMGVEATSSEAVKQNKQHISSPECETAETDGLHEQMQKSIAGETVWRIHENLIEASRPGTKRGFDQVSKDLPEVKTEGKFDLILQRFEDSYLDFSVQKSRIAVKNPLVRPPKDPRKLLFKSSAKPLAQPSARSQTLQVSAPSKAVIGFKLPGLGAGLPVLRKAELGPKAREGEVERALQPQPKSVAVTEDSVKQEQVPAKPTWTPPRHPGMGSPFMMAELKSKLKKPVQE